MAAAKSIFTTDHGHTVKRCNSALGACASLSVTPKEQRFWDQLTAYWRAQLGFAEKKGRK